MHPSYLRVKNWARYQHYDPLKRRPPWIKFYNDLLGDDDEFMRLDEQEQWQLVRIWLVASRSSSLTADDNGVVVPVVANDSATLQRSIMSLKKVPLEKFIREGWLIPVAEEELIHTRDGASGGASGAQADPPPGASNGASTPASALLELEIQREPQAVTSLETRRARQSNGTAQGFQIPDNLVKELLP